MRIGVRKAEFRSDGKNSVAGMLSIYGVPYTLNPRCTLFLRYSDAGRWDPVHNNLPLKLLDTSRADIISASADNQGWFYNVRLGHLYHIDEHLGVSFVGTGPAALEGVMCCHGQSLYFFLVLGGAGRLFQSVVHLYVYNIATKEFLTTAAEIRAVPAFTASLEGRCLLVTNYLNDQGARLGIVDVQLEKGKLFFRNVDVGAPECKRVNLTVTLEERYIVSFYSHDMKDYLLLYDACTNLYMRCRSPLDASVFSDSVGVVLGKSYRVIMRKNWFAMPRDVLNVLYRTEASHSEVVDETFSVPKARIAQSASANAGASPALSRTGSPSFVLQRSQRTPGADGRPPRGASSPTHSIRYNPLPASSLSRCNESSHSEDRDRLKGDADQLDIEQLSAQALFSGAPVQRPPSSHSPKKIYGLSNRALDTPVETSTDPRRSRVVIDNIPLINEIKRPCIVTRPASTQHRGGASTSPRASAANAPRDKAGLAPSRASMRSASAAGVTALTDAVPTFKYSVTESYRDAMQPRRAPSLPLRTLAAGAQKADKPERPPEASQADAGEARRAKARTYLESVAHDDLSRQCRAVMAENEALRGRLSELEQKLLMAVGRLDAVSGASITGRDDANGLKARVLYLEDRVEQLEEALCSAAGPSGATLRTLSSDIRISAGK